MDAITPPTDFAALRRALDEAHEIAAVAGIRDQAIVEETHARRARNKEATRQAREIQLLAIRKGGQLLTKSGQAGLRKSGRATKGSARVRLRGFQRSQT
jgi:hypothetical protein